MPLAQPITCNYQNQTHQPEIKHHQSKTHHRWSAKATFKLAPPSTTHPITSKTYLQAPTQQSPATTQQALPSNHPTKPQNLMQPLINADLNPKTIANHWLMLIGSWERERERERERARREKRESHGEEKDKRGYKKYFVSGSEYSVSLDVVRSMWMLNFIASLLRLMRRFLWVFSYIFNLRLVCCLTIFPLIFILKYGNHYLKININLI